MSKEKEFKKTVPTLEQMGELRKKFPVLLLSNPNYFGNLKISQFTPVVQLSSNTTYEDIGCVGFQPQINRLEAVVYINQPTGYGGGICSVGTPEYVRFYLSFNNGVTWEDQGLTSFQAHDIPEGTEGRKRLEYATGLVITPKKRVCTVENIILARAILSWNVPPPPNTPDFQPVWGDTHDTHIVVDPKKFWFLRDILSTAGKIPTLPVLVDMDYPIPVPEPEPLTVYQLEKLYQNKGVELHRFALTEIKKFIEQPSFKGALITATASDLTTSAVGSFLPGLTSPVLNPDLLFPTDGNTRYEELECVGLDPGDGIIGALVGTLRVKLPNGYSGGACTKGSLEYVTFWGDFNNNGTFETCLGTTSVRVYDMNNIPEKGLEYAVRLPLSLVKYKRPCENGPRLVPIRAILSWNVAPPCWNSHYIPVWGNREETVVQIPAGQNIPVSEHPPIIQTAGSMRVSSDPAVNTVDPITGLANGLAALAGFTAHDSPFGGEVILTGHLANPTNISGGATKLKYRVEISQNNFSTEEYVTNGFSLGRDRFDQDTSTWSALANSNQSVDGGSYYEYQEDLTGPILIFPVGNVLARWDTGGKEGIWKIRIRATDPANLGPEWLSNVVTLKLDNTAPDAAITITSGGGACADFMIGDVIEGTYEATDTHFSSLTLSVAPAMGGSFTAPAPLPAGATMPLSRSYAAGVPGTGEIGVWHLDTAGMPRCGYIVHLGVADRTIVNSGGIGRHDGAVVGLCLRENEA